MLASFLYVVSIFNGYAMKNMFPLSIPVLCSPMTHMMALSRRLRYRRHASPLHFTTLFCAERWMTLSWRLSFKRGNFPFPWMLLVYSHVTGTSKMSQLKPFSLSFSVGAGSIFDVVFLLDCCAMDDMFPLFTTFVPLRHAEWHYLDGCVSKGETSIFLGHYRYSPMCRF